MFYDEENERNVIQHVLMLYVHIFCVIVLCGLFKYLQVAHRTAIPADRIPCLQSSAPSPL